MEFIALGLGAKPRELVEVAPLLYLEEIWFPAAFKELV
jgi:hypothetical protein